MVMYLRSVRWSAKHEAGSASKMCMTKFMTSCMTFATTAEPKNEIKEVAH